MQTQIPVLQSCEGCRGSCCREQASPPMYVLLLLNPGFDPESEDSVRVHSLPEELKTELRSYAAHLMQHGSHPNKEVCIWLNESTNQCKHYDIRPDVCRDFELGSDDCRGWREKYGIAT